MLRVRAMMCVCDHDVCVCVCPQLDLSSYEDQIKVVTATRDKVVKECEALGEELTEARRHLGLLQDKCDLLTAHQVNKQATHAHAHTSHTHTHAHTCSLCVSHIHTLTHA